MTLAPRGTTAPITRKQAMYLLSTIWPDVPETEVVKAAMLCQQYNLNPLRKQIYIIPFTKKGGGTNYAIVLGISASRAIAQSQGYKYSYTDGPRVMSEQEQVEILGAADPRFVWAITKLIDRDGNVFPGYGAWPDDTDVYGADKGNSKRNMAFIRSERNALDRMAPGTLPDVEIYDESYSPVIPQEAIAAGEKEWHEAIQEDKTNLWEPDPDPVVPEPEFDMVWLKEELDSIRAKAPLVYQQLGIQLKKMLDGKRAKSWTEAIGMITPEQAAKFCEMVGKVSNLK